MTEARHDGEIFGEQRLLAAVDSLRGCSAQEMADGLAATAVTFGGSLRDDLNIVVARLA